MSEKPPVSDPGDAVQQQKEVRPKSTRVECNGTMLALTAPLLLAIGLQRTKSDAGNFWSFVGFG